MLGTCKHLYGYSHITLIHSFICFFPLLFCFAFFRSKFLDPLISEGIAIKHEKVYLGLVSEWFILLFGELCIIHIQRDKLGHNSWFLEH